MSAYVPFLQPQFFRPRETGGGGGGSGFSLLAQNIYSPNANSLTTSWTMDTTGSDLIVFFIGTYGAVMPTTVTDSAGNTYDPGTPYGSNYGTQIWYKRAPITGSAVTFTSDAYILYTFYSIMAFSGSVASPLDQQNGNPDAATGGNDFIQTGSITPSNNAQLIVSGVFNYATGATPSIDSSFDATYGVAKSSFIGMGGAAYKIQATAAPINPTWTSVGTAGNSLTACIASFKSQ